MPDQSDKAALMEAMASSRDSRKEEIIEERKISEEERLAKAEKAKILIAKIRKPFDHLMPNSPEEEEMEDDYEELESFTGICPSCGFEHREKKEEEMGDYPKERIIDRVMLKRRMGRRFRRDED